MHGRWCQKGQDDPRGYGPGRVSPRGQRVPQELEAAQVPFCPAAFLPQISPALGRDCGNQRLEKTQWFILISTCDILVQVEAEFLTVFKFQSLHLFHEASSLFQ